MVCPREIQMKVMPKRALGWGGPIIKGLDWYWCSSSAGMINLHGIKGGRKLNTVNITLQYHVKWEDSFHWFISGVHVMHDD